jgi:hypothetical protein
VAGQLVRQRIVVPFTGHRIGEGFNSDTVERVGTGLDVANIGEDPFAPGQDAAFRFRMVTSQSSLEEALNIGVEVEARYGLFSGGAKFDFAQSQAVNSSSTYIVASALVSNALRSGSGFTPNAAAAPLVDAGLTDEFKLAFGDRFCEALHTGGEFHALVRVTSSSTQHQRNISASLHAELNGLFAAGSFSAALQSARQDTSSHTEVVIEVHQTSGVGEQVQIPGTDANQIREHMNRFAAAAHQNAAAYKAELVTYDTLALPFPRPEELEDRRRVLEDCLARRQIYWSAISDLTFAQSEDARLIFDDLPSPEQLVALQNDFRRILNDLMTHARNVSSGAIEPTFFVAAEEPPLPRFKRRNASRFATWWAQRNEPNLLQDERFMITRISEEARFSLTVPLEEAPPETVERAADQIRALDLTFSGIDSVIPLRSMARLPDMIDAPLREVVADRTELEDLSGLEPFSRLEVAKFRGGRSLRDVRALTSAAGLAELHLTANSIMDLSPLRALTRLQWLFIAGNGVQSLEPLRDLHDLTLLSFARVDPGSTEGIHLENPIVDARALARLTQLANPLVSADNLTLRLFSAHFPDTFITSGPATRIGDSHRFRFAPFDGALDGSETEEVRIMALCMFGDIRVVPEPVVMTALHFPSRRMEGVPGASYGVASTPLGDRSGSLAASDLGAILNGQFPTLDGNLVPFTDDGGPGEIFVVSGIGLQRGSLPSLIVEVEPA